jgi:phosphopantetheinyl transferase (holo-ACP synthase)
MININKILKRIKCINKILFVLSPGLFTIDNEYIEGSYTIVDYIKFKIGTPIRIRDNDYKNYTKENLTLFFEPVSLYKSKPFKTINETDLTIDIMLKEIENFKFDKKKTPYENYLEVTLLIYLLESISSRKSLLSGIWGGKEILAKALNTNKGHFEEFLENINEKNYIIKKIKKHLAFYPEEYFDKLKEYDDFEFDENNSQYATFLNYRILQIKYKIKLQDRCSLINTMDYEQKLKVDSSIHNIKMMMHTYPVIN